MRNIGIYVQVPFCQTKCTYCNFHTGVVAGSRFAPYVEAVCQEIREHRELLRAAGVGWDGRLGCSDAAPLQSERETPGGGGKRPASPTGSGQAPGGPYSGTNLLVDTVYMGGGTPSLLDPVHLQNILDTIREAFGSGSGADSRGDRKGGGEPPHSMVPALGDGACGSREWPGRLGGSSAAPLQGQERQATGGPCGPKIEEVTLEVDPETVEAGKAGAWVGAGIDRVSFGLQSFVDKELVVAGRMHRRADIYRAVPILREAGIRNISFDLIAGLPHQTKDSWRQSLEELAVLAPEHVSVYLLEIDEGSRLGKELLQGGRRYSAGAVPSEDVMAEFYEMAQEALRSAGYHHYEISNWAKPGFESKHNLKYWRREPYLGFGAGAHSFSGTERWANAHDAAAYVTAVQAGRLPVEQHETLTAESALEEELFLGLRQLDGIDLGRIEREYGVALASRFERVASAGLVEREGGTVRLAAEKLSVSNEVFVELLR
jgi:oxygen-independent coproporphyrinogen-3 oxidase